MNRREIIKKVGLATMVVLPVITGLTAPKAANAASQGPPPEELVSPAGLIYVAVAPPEVMLTLQTLEVTVRPTAHAAAMAQL